MRALILTTILMLLSAQTLALAAAPACNHQGAGPHGAQAAKMLSNMEHDHSHAQSHPVGPVSDHSDMPCCQDSADAAAEELCQLTCAAGVCGAVALLASDWQLSPIPPARPFRGTSPTTLAASPRNLLRPPIGA